jgi:hypothetical protein
MNATPIDDGGTAFPCTRQIRCAGSVVDTQEMSGMTLRDYFAAALMPSIMLRRFQIIDENEEERGIGIETKELAEAAYIAADAMLKARKEKP